MLKFKIENFIDRFFRFLSNHTFIIVIIVICLFYIDLNYLGILKTVLVNVDGNFDYNIMWNAIGSISTATAVFIALFQFNIQNRKNVKLEFDQSTLVQGSIITGTFLELSIQNRGLRSIKISSWRFIYKGNKHLFIIPCSAFGLDISFPIQIESEEASSLYFPLERFIGVVKHYGFDENKRLNMYIIDSIGSRYYLKSKYKIKYYLENRFQDK